MRLRHKHKCGSDRLPDDVNAIVERVENRVTEFAQGRRIVESYVAVGQRQCLHEIELLFARGQSLQSLDQVDALAQTEIMFS